MALPIKGEVGIISVYDGAIFRPVACLTSNSLSATVSVIESNTKCNPGVTIKQGGMSNYSIQADGEYIDTTSVGGETTKASHDFLFKRLQTKEMQIWKLDTGVVDAIYYGNGIISDLSLDQGAGDELSTFSMTIDVSGEVVFEDPTV